MFVGNLKGLSVSCLSRAASCHLSIYIESLCIWVAIWSLKVWQFLN